MNRIRFFKQNTVDRLREGVGENLAWYRDEGNTSLDEMLGEYGEMSKEVDGACFGALNENTDEKSDIDNVLSIYKTFGCLSPQQAAEERIWVYATHVSAKQYTARRWSKIPADSDKATKYIRLHYFASGPRGLMRDNAIARLWWMGYLASRCQDYNLEKTLRILLKDSDVRANLLERSSLSMSKEIFSGVIRVLGKDFDEEKESSGIYQRANFRELMRKLNQRGGRIMLNALNAKQLDSMLDDMVKQIIAIPASNQ